MHAAKDYLARSLRLGARLSRWFVAAPDRYTDRAYRRSGRSGLKLSATTCDPIGEELVISTKAGYEMWLGPYGEWGSRKYLLASLDQSLRRMGLAYVDIYYSHRFDPETPLECMQSARERA